MKLNTTKKAFMKSAALIFLGLLIIAAIILAYTIAATPIIDAQLHVESGIVKINGKQSTGITKLSQGDVIETQEGLGTVILQESILVSLQPNTKITIDDLTQEHPAVTQQSGTTWNKFMHLLGVDKFSIKTSNSIASVRGTSFVLNEQKIFTSEGNVNYETQGKTFTVQEMTAVEQKENKPVQRNINNDEKTIMKQHFKRTIEEIKNLRELEINKHKTIVTILQKKFGFTEQQMKDELDKADNNKSNVDDLLNKLPFKIQSATRIATMTKEIQKMQKKINDLNTNG